MTDQLQKTIDRLQDAEYLHVLLETAPVYGIFAGLLLLTVALGMKNFRFQALALGLICIASLTSYPQLANRKLAEQPVLEAKSAADGSRIKAQTELRASKQWAYLSLAFACLVTIATRKAKVGQIILGLTLVGSIGVGLLSIWLHIQDTEILYPNIGSGPTPRAEVLPEKLPNLPSKLPDLSKKLDAILPGSG